MKCPRRISRKTICRTDQRNEHTAQLRTGEIRFFADATYWDPWVIGMEYNMPLVMIRRHRQARRAAKAWVGCGRGQRRGRLR